ncbi:MAG: hypothetical protein ACOCWR_04510 [Oceanidesulfovibrio sp.]
MFKNFCCARGISLIAMCMLVGMMGLLYNPGQVHAQDNIINPDSEDIPDANTELFNQWVRFLAVVEENLAVAAVAADGKLLNFTVAEEESEGGVVQEADQTLALFTNILQSLVTRGTPEDYLALVSSIEEHNSAVKMIQAYYAQLNAHQDAFDSIHNTLDPLETIDFDEDVDDNFFVVENIDKQLRKTPGGGGGQ